MPGLSGRALALTCTGSGLVPSRPPTKKKSSLQRVGNFRLEIFNFMLQAMGQIKLGVSWYKQYSRKLYEKLNLCGLACCPGFDPWEREKARNRGREKESCKELHLGNGLNDHVSIKHSTFPLAPLPYLPFYMECPSPIWKILLSLQKTTLLAKKWSL